MRIIGKERKKKELMLSCYNLYKTYL